MFGTQSTASAVAMSRFRNRAGREWNGTKRSVNACAKKRNVVTENNEILNADAFVLSAHVPLVKFLIRNANAKIIYLGSVFIRNTTES